MKKLKIIMPHRNEAAVLRPSVLAKFKDRFSARGIDVEVLEIDNEGILSRLDEVRASLGGSASLTVFLNFVANFLDAILRFQVAIDNMEDSNVLELHAYAYTGKVDFFQFLLVPVIPDSKMSFFSVVQVLETLVLSNFSEIESQTLRDILEIYLQILRSKIHILRSRFRTSRLLGLEIPATAIHVDKPLGLTDYEMHYAFPNMGEPIFTPAELDAAVDMVLERL